MVSVQSGRNRGVFILRKCLLISFECVIKYIFNFGHDILLCPPLTILFYKGDMSMNQNKSVTTLPIPISPEVSFPSVKDMNGSVRFNMTNDYMFRAVLQTNNKVLRGLICSLLHFSEAEILSAEIVNPIILGESIDNKEFQLDIHICLNNSMFINLEMQLIDKLNWQNRSILYLCRSFDQLKHGQNYLEAKPAIHIGFLNYTLFEEFSEFYATYKLINVKKHYIYSDSLTLSVVNLSRTDLATEEDKKYHLDSWAKLFKANTWEEIAMLASDNNYMNEAARTMFQLSADEQIRERCLAREEYYQEVRAYKKIIAEQESNYENMVAEKDADIRNLKEEIRRLRTKLDNEFV